MTKTSDLSTVDTTKVDEKVSSQKADQPPRVRVGDALMPWSKAPKARLGDALMPW